MDTDNLMSHLRKKKKITQRELARKCKLAPSYISELENKEKINPSVNTINKLERVLGPEIRDFFLN